MNKKKEENNLVYLIQMGDTKYYKIGITKNINNRIKSLQTGNPLPLHTVTTIELGELYMNLVKDLEKQLHLLFSYCRKYGEWFKFENKEQDIIINWSKKYIINDFNDFCKLIGTVIAERKAQEQEEEF